MTDKEVLQRYVDLVPFLNTILGSGAEIAVHDIKHPDRSLLAIANPLSGRKVGSPMTDFAKDIIEKGMHTDQDFLANYDGSAKGVNFLSSTYLIKNNHKLIGLLCINKNISSTRNLMASISSFLAENNLSAPEQSTYHENLDTKVEDFIEARVAKVIASFGVAPDRLNAKEKANIVKSLNEDGILKLKGAIDEAAKQLSVSVPTIYRYIKQ